MKKKTKQIVAEFENNIFLESGFQIGGMGANEVLYICLEFLKDYVASRGDIYYYGEASYVEARKGIHPLKINKTKFK
jgi:hypothetical protein